MVLPVEGATVNLEAVVLAVVVVEGLVVADVGLDVLDAGRAVEGPVTGLEAEKEGHVKVANKHVIPKKKLNKNKRSLIFFGKGPSMKCDAAPLHAFTSLNK